MDTTSAPDAAPAQDARRLRGDSGASLVEYALLLALIAVVCIAAVSFLGGALDDSYSKSASLVADA
jgi:Flp pilus assembly pilin Flp